MTAGPFWIDGKHFVRYFESYSRPPYDSWVRSICESLPFDDYIKVPGRGGGGVELLMHRLHQAHRMCEHAVLEALSR